MHPKLFTLPGGIEITTYGFCLTVAFLSAVWLAMRRAQRVGADPDCVLDLSFLALVFGVAGARVMFVAHYWADFKDAPNTILAIVDIRQGGLEFLGGLVAASAASLLYLLVKRHSLRLYLDIMAPGAMWGSAIGRIGCFFNGCCFGGLCVVAGTGSASHLPSVQFPFGSGAQVRQWSDRQVAVPAELIVSFRDESHLLPAAALQVGVEQRQRTLKAFEDARQALTKARTAGAAPDAISKLQRNMDSARTRISKLQLDFLLAAQKFPSRKNPDRQTSVSELEELASSVSSRPVHPTQLYSTVHSFLLCGVLTALFYRRKRHGVVIGVLFLLYPIGRILLEMIRADNPHDIGGLTISQSIGLAVSLGAAVYLFILYRYMPERAAIREPKPQIATK